MRLSHRVRVRARCSHLVHAVMRLSHVDDEAYEHLHEDNRDEEGVGGEETHGEETADVLCILHHLRVRVRVRVRVKPLLSSVCC